VDGEPNELERDCNHPDLMGPDGSTIVAGRRRERAGKRAGKEAGKDREKFGG